MVNFVFALATIVNTCSYYMLSFFRFNRRLFGFNATGYIRFRIIGIRFYRFIATRFIRVNRRCFWHNTTSSSITLSTCITKRNITVVHSFRTCQQAFRNLYIAVQVTFILSICSVEQFISHIIQYCITSSSIFHATVVISTQGDKAVFRSTANGYIATCDFIFIIMFIKYYCITAIVINLDIFTI